MSIPVPNLDDRTFAELVAAARERIRQIDPEWTDLSVHDPGIVILEAFAFLTETLLYRVNRVPEKLYAVFLNLLGTSLYPPSTAETTLEFSRAAPGTEPIPIPRGTQVGCVPGVPGAPQPVFSTTVAAVLEAGQASVLVPAADATLYDAVPIGVGNGRPGQSFVIPNAPIVSGAGLAIAIEVPSGTRLSSGEAVLVDGKPFRFCREVEAFADADPDQAAVKIDRSAGVAMFAWWDERRTAGSPGAGRVSPGAGVPGAAVPGPVVPGAGAEVRAWYRSGGGERGNVGPGQLTVLRTPVPGVRVMNPGPATGGRDGEPLENALRRAPQDFQARDRAVTVRDYEVLAARHGGVARARAFTRKDLWAFARPGEVEIVLVPFVPGHGGGVTAGSAAASGAGAPSASPIRPAELRTHARSEVRDDVEGYLRRRSTVGAEPVVRWGLYKQVLVDARIVVRADEDAGSVRSRIIGRLSEAISPWAAGNAGYGSGFGKPLRVSNLYRAMEEAEPGVQYVDRVRLEVDKVPDTDAVGLVQADGQSRTWFVAQQDTLFRTTNSGDGWEACAEFSTASDAETVRSIAPFRSPAPGRAGPEKHPGMVAVSTVTATGSRVYVSEDLGESWRRAAELGFVVADLCWVDRQGTAVLLLAGERGLYELPMGADAIPVQNLVDAGQPDRGFYAVDAFVDVRGRTGVVVAAEASAGIWLSPDAAAAGSFRQVKAAGEDIRCLAIQYDGGASYIWLGRSVPEGTGTGCLRLKIDELARTQLDSLQGSWEQFSTGWTGGSCWGVHVTGKAVYAATQSGGVLRFPLGQSSAAWSVPGVNCGLPLRDRTRFEPVRSVSGAVLKESDSGDGGTALILAAGPKGIYRSTDDTASWHSCTRRVVDDVVTLPESWLFCSGEHRIEVVHGHE